MRVPHSIGDIADGLCAVEAAILRTLNQMSVAKLQTVLLRRRRHIHDLTGSFLDFEEMCFRVRRESVFVSIIGENQDDFEPFLMLLLSHNEVSNQLTESRLASQTKELHVCLGRRDEGQEPVLYPHENFSFLSRRNFLMTDKATGLLLQTLPCHNQSILSSVSFANIIPQHGRNMI